mmetsp:Transcript_16365/g.44830  ORF Transcript_16365/g.44830 Transcript_16365/m.44830 type:complete len:265 (-) Transcript_16365:155-949(-)
MVVAEARVLGRRRRLLLDRQLQLLLRLCVLALGAVLAAGAPQVGAGVPAALCVSLHQQLLLLFLPRLEAVGIGEIGGCERQPLLQQRHELDGGWLAGVHNVRRLCGDDDASKVQAGDDRILTHQECATRGRLLQQPQVTALDTQLCNELHPALSDHSAVASRIDAHPRLLQYTRLWLLRQRGHRVMVVVKEMEVLLAVYAVSGCGRVSMHGLRELCGRHAGAALLKEASNRCFAGPAQQRTPSNTMAAAQKCTEVTFACTKIRV